MGSFPPGVVHPSTTESAFGERQVTQAVSSGSMDVVELVTDNSEHIGSQHETNGLSRLAEPTSDLIGLEAIWIGLEWTENGWIGFHVSQNLDWIGLIGNRLLELQWPNPIWPGLSLIWWL